MSNVIADLGLPGLLVYRNVALKATKQQAKGGAGRVYGWTLLNLDAAVAYVHLYDALSADVTVGTTTPLISVGLAASGAYQLALPAPVEFTTGLTVAATTTVGGSTAPSNGELLNLFYI